jgi:hypothetical protein
MSPCRGKRCAQRALARTSSTISKARFIRACCEESVDERGYICIVDRKKDMILVSAFNVYPTEIEAVEHFGFLLDSGVSKIAFVNRRSSEPSALEFRHQLHLR